MIADHHYHLRARRCESREVRTLCEAISIIYQVVLTREVVLAILHGTLPGVCMFQGAMMYTRCVRLRAKNTTGEHNIMCSQYGFSFRVVNSNGKVIQR